MTENSRSCGGCTACCEGWLSDESLSMKPGSPCANCTDQGCGIYETRPTNPCRIFTCAWLQDPEEFPEELRPDKSGAICSVDRDWYQWKVLRAFPVGASIPQHTFDWLLAYAKGKRLPFLFLEHTLENGEYVSVAENALGPPAFAAEVKSRPSMGDTFWGMTPRD